MKMMRLALLAAAAIGGAALAKDRPYSYVKVYYTDNTRTGVAGRETSYCDGGYESFGTETPYFRYYNGQCP